MAGKRQCGSGSRAAAIAAREANQRLEDIPMCRHIGLSPITTGRCCAERQLRELNQVLERQNQILTELLQAVLWQNREPQHKKNGTV